MINKLVVILGNCDIVFFFFKKPATPEFYPFPLPDAFPIGVVAAADVRDELLVGDAAPDDHLRAGPSGRTPGPARGSADGGKIGTPGVRAGVIPLSRVEPDRKSTRLNSSHLVISYAVFCLKK